MEHTAILGSAAAMATAAITGGVGVLGGGAVLREDSRETSGKRRQNWNTFATSARLAAAAAARHQVQIVGNIIRGFLGK